MVNSFAYPTEPGPPFCALSSDGPGLPDWAATACDEVDRAGLRELIVGRCRDVFEPGVADDDFAEVLRRSVAENLDTLVGWLNGRLDLLHLRLEQPLSFAMIQAQLSVPQADVQRSYRVSFLTIWDVMAEAVRSRARLQERSESEAGAALHVLTRAVFTYQDFVTSQAVAQYSRVESTLSQSKSRLRQQLIRELLRGDAHPLPAADLALLEYDLSLQHIAAVLLGTTVTGAERLVREARALGVCRDGLVYRRSLQSSTVWFGRGSEWSRESEDALVDLLRGQADIVVLSAPHSGPAGLAASAREAEQVVAVRSLDAGAPAPSLPRIIRYRDVMLDMLLLADRQRAQDFVAFVLGPLALDTPEADRLRATVESSLRLGSHVAAAADLGVHEQTVRNRLARVEELWGEPLRLRRAEAEAALRLIRILGPLPRDGGAER